MLSSDQDPLQQSSLRKLRAFMGFLMNTEEVLQAKGYDLAEAYGFALREHDRLEDLEEAAGGPSVSHLREWRRHQQWVEQCLFQRWETAVSFLQTHAPDHPLLPLYLSYRARWRQAWPLPDLQTQAPSVGPATGPTVFGLPLDQLLHLRARLSSLPLPHVYVRHYAVFLAGLSYAAHGQAASGQPPAHPPEDELLAVSSTCLEAAVDFAMQAEPQALARTSARLPADTAFHCLFMGVAFVQENADAYVGDWLQRGARQENLLRLFFAMGVSALTARCARRLVQQIQDKLPQLTSQHLGHGIDRLLEEF